MKRSGHIAPDIGWGNGTVPRKQLCVPRTALGHALKCRRLGE